jgi:hypothetical protein
MGRPLPVIRVGSVPLVALKKNGYVGHHVFQQKENVGSPALRAIEIVMLHATIRAGCAFRPVATQQMRVWKTVGGHVADPTQAGPTTRSQTGPDRVLLLCPNRRTDGLFLTRLLMTHVTGIALIVAL